jgi:hypothetical protein
MLQSQGHFYDPVQREVEVLFMGDLIKKIVGRSESYEAASAIAKELVDAARAKAKVFEAKAIALRKELYAKQEKERLLKLE